MPSSSCSSGRNGIPELARGLGTGIREFKRRVRDEGKKK
ncbi:MAG: twin-arginine translocase TatA/TatE family subunit [Rubrobacter sp.]|nr:twin-arginine translocase TatA/TatE family subunit [Rubrobacter sp.]